jgi:hypothetical protein
MKRLRRSRSFLDNALEVGDVVVAVGRLRYRGKSSGVEQDVAFGWVVKFGEAKLVYLRASRDPAQVLLGLGRPT